jgi:purine nucleosidase
LKLVLDMDTGVDDAVAIALALGSSGVELLAITSVCGNAPVDLCTRNCLLLNELLGGQALVARGAERPLARRLLTAQEVHGADGLGGRLGSLPEPRTHAIDVPAHELLCRIPLEHPGEVTLVTTGPLTNVALALDENAEALGRYSRMITMGGAFDVPGNTGPVAEFNMYVDPEAAARVISSPLDITLVPLDATTQAILTREELEGRELARGFPRDVPGRDAAAILHRALDHYMEFQFDESGLDGGYMHDPLAVAAAIEPDVLDTVVLDVSVVTGDRDRGRTVRVPPNGRGRGRTARVPPDAHTAAIGRGVRVAVGHDAAAFRAMLRDRVLSPVFGGERTARR